MVVQRIDDKVRVKRDRTKLAIKQAMESRWEEAVALNRLILQADAKDVEALNRMGKALSELGRYVEARQTFTKALSISPNNSIAKKNVERLGLLRKDARKRPQHSRVPPQFFIEESAKTVVTALLDPATESVLAKMSPGEPVQLEAGNHSLVVKNTDGECLGTLPPKLGLRLIALMDGGNRYAAALTSVGHGEIRVFIRETHQHMSQRGRPSFPPKSADDFRPYAWEGAYSYGKDEDDDAFSPGMDDWDDSTDDGPPILGRSRRRVAATAVGDL
ncbi:MAG: tetratricopeptide repeat protein [Chloroflexi bacterium]|nr:tetratricopeptide repeat protein [Chloroflexota bacterium]